MRTLMIAMFLLFLSPMSVLADQTTELTEYHDVLHGDWMVLKFKSNLPAAKNPAVVFYEAMNISPENDSNGSPVKTIKSDTTVSSISCRRESLDAASCRVVLYHGLWCSMDWYGSYAYCKLTGKAADEYSSFIRFHLKERSEFDIIDYSSGRERHLQIVSDDGFFLVSFVR